MPGDKFRLLVEEGLASIDTKESRINRINQIKSQIANLENQMTELNTQLRNETHALLGDLAVSVKKSIPGVSISLDGDSCSISHMSNKLSVKPDFVNNVWNIDPNISGRRFKRAHGHSLLLGQDTSVLANEVANYFKGHYKKLSEGRPIKRVQVSQTAGGTQFT